MSKTKSELAEAGKLFGERLAKFRRAAGYSQRAFAAEIGISQRMVVYYEKHCERIPVHTLSLFAKTLGVTSDQLLGLEEAKDNSKYRTNRLWKRFSKVEKLPPVKYRQVVQVIDAFLDREKLQEKS